VAGSAHTCAEEGGGVDGDGVSGEDDGEGDGEDDGDGVGGEDDGEDDGEDVNTSLPVGFPTSAYLAGRESPSVPPTYTKYPLAMYAYMTVGAESHLNVVLVIVAGGYETPPIKIASKPGIASIGVVKVAFSASIRVPSMVAGRV
jgi:hypothetical protein